jgi:tetratricopeptide (TPR) repeat protein
MTANEIGGSARLTGVTVQASTVSGGIHYYRSASPIPPPCQLPRVPRHFTDREEDVRALDVSRDGGATLVVLCGIAGVGKSALAVRWLRARGAYGDGQLYADLHTPNGPASREMVLQQWLRAFGLEQPPADLSELTALWRSVTARRTVAVLLDNAVEASQVRPLLPSGDSSMTVVTGRSRSRLWELAADGAEFHQVGAFTPSAALGLLARFAGQARVTAEPDAAARLTQSCAHLALPIVLAGARLATRPQISLSAAADALTRRTVKGSHRKDHARMAMIAALDESYANLEPSAQRVYRFLGLLPVDDIDPDMVAAACRLAWSDADWLLEVLADEHLLEAIAPLETRPVRYRMGAVVGEHARDLAEQYDDAATREGVLCRLSKWMLEIATLAQTQLTPAQATLRKAQGMPPTTARPPFEDEEGALAWLAAQARNLLGVLRAAEAKGWNDLAWELVDAYWPHFHRTHPYGLWIEAHQIGVAAARKAGNRAAVRQMLISGAIGLTAAGRWDDAISWYADARDAARKEGDVRDEGQALLGIAACHLEAGRPQEAEPHLDEAIARWDDCCYSRGIALAVTVRGEIALAADQPHQATELFVHARDALLAVDDPYDAARARALHGHALTLTGDTSAGIRELEDALMVLAGAGSTRWQARVLELLGVAHQLHGDRDAARRSFVQAADLYAVIRPVDAARVRELAAAL